MSVIAWDGKTVAADRQISGNGVCQTGRKIRRLASGEVIGWVGSYENGLAVAQWYEDGADPTLWPETQSGADWSPLIVFGPDGAALEFEKLPIHQVVEDSFFAWGSGRELAIGAMAAGADPRQAVVIANRYSTGCGLGVDVIEIA